jgi:regulatory protein
MQKEKNTSPEQARQMLMKICSVKEMCRFDLKKKLELWNIEPNEQEKIMEYLEQEKFFCDKRYSAAFINDKSRLQKWGRIKIKHTLLAKRVSEDIIEDLLQHPKGTDYMQNLEDLLKKKVRTIKYSESKQQSKARLYRYAMGKGYEPEMIMKVLDKLVNE